VSVRDGDAERALGLLAEAEVTCREMNLSSALAYNHKMRGNVLYRAGRYAEARDVYSQALAEFRAMSEPRGEALSRLGLTKSLAHLGHDLDDTAAELADLAQVLERIGLRHARQMVARAQAEFGIVAATDVQTATAPDTDAQTATPPDTDAAQTATLPDADAQTATAKDTGPRTGPGASAGSAKPAAVGTDTAAAATPTPGTPAATATATETDATAAAAAAAAVGIPASTLAGTEVRR